MQNEYTDLQLKHPLVIHITVEKMLLEIILLILALKIYTVPILQTTVLDVLLKYKVTYFKRED